MQSQLVCSGCRTILLYPRGATNVCCAVCNALTPVPPPGISASCHKILNVGNGDGSDGSTDMWGLPHTSDASTGSNQCKMLLLSYGEPCARTKSVCSYQLWELSDNADAGDARVPIPSHPPNGSATSSSAPPSSTAAPRSQNQTVVVQNPMSVDESGKLVGFSPLLQLLSHTSVDNGSVGERIRVKVREVEIKVVHIGVALAEPGRGADEVPPLVGEVLHRVIRRRHEDRSVWIECRGRHFRDRRICVERKRKVLARKILRLGVSF
nr:protein LOL2-like isoform X1 [Ipomoea trifida]